MAAATISRCACAPSPAASAALPLAAPAMPPRLNMPCMPLMSGVPPCSSSWAASVLIDTSNTLVTRPNAASSTSSAA
jgi:hypothetical protein